MKVIISSTYSDNYFFFVPIVSWCWSKLGVDAICFLPSMQFKDETRKLDLINQTILNKDIKCKFHTFTCPEHKESTYAQCSRLFGGALNLPLNEILITSDVDMAVFKTPPNEDNSFIVFGQDLVPSGQSPMCYASAPVKIWRSVMNIDGKTYQRCLDELLGHIETDHFRGNYWSKDQEKLWQSAKDILVAVNRTNGQNQFATKRIDRDDAYWHERLNLDILDAHLWRPGYAEENFQRILMLLQYFYPNEGFDWLIEYRRKYMELI